MTAPRRRALVLALALSLALLLAAPAGAAGADAGAPDPQPPALSPGGAGLRLDRSAEVALLLPSTAPFWEEVRAAAQAAAQRSGLGLICRSAHLTVDGEVQVTQLLEVDALSGLGAALLVPAQSDVAALAQAAGATLPVLALDGADSWAPLFSAQRLAEMSLSWCQAQPGRQQGVWLLCGGARQGALVQGAQLLEDQLQAAGIPTRLTVGDGTQRGGEEAAEQALAYGILPDVLLCCDEETAAGALPALRAAGWDGRCLVWGGSSWSDQALAGGQADAVLDLQPDRLGTWIVDRYLGRTAGGRLVPRPGPRLVTAAGA